MKEIIYLFLKFLIGFVGAILIVQLIGTNFSLLDHIPLITGVILFYLLLSTIIVTYSKRKKA